MIPTKRKPLKSSFKKKEVYKKIATVGLGTLLTITTMKGLTIEQKKMLNNSQIKIENVFNARNTNINQKISEEIRSLNQKTKNNELFFWNPYKRKIEFLKIDAKNTKKLYSVLTTTQKTKLNNLKEKIIKRVSKQRNLEEIKSNLSFSQFYNLLSAEEKKEASKILEEREKKRQQKVIIGGSFFVGTKILSYFLFHMIRTKRKKHKKMMSDEKS